MPWRRLITSYRAVGRPATCRPTAVRCRPASLPVPPSLPASLPAYIHTWLLLDCMPSGLGKIMCGHTSEIDNR